MLVLLVRVRLVSALVCPLERCTTGGARSSTGEGSGFVVRCLREVGPRLFIVVVGNEVEDFEPVELW